MGWCCNYPNNFLLLGLGQTNLMSLETTPPVQSSSSTSSGTVSLSLSDLAFVKLISPKELWLNRIANMEHSAPEGEILPLGHRNPKMLLLKVTNLSFKDGSNLNNTSLTREDALNEE
ncbi:hypothetical protein AVEN_159454-1 [Araneus ventricosus]|uniref:Uncharacterized protein n=1 Tax=Araneus ventricosus TaxID=182803 RepID=A0A4Y2A0Y0_ARAVE|nr:hypothetical protein AVEN_159454-1 [Araneus ventricosus]